MRGRCGSRLIPGLERYCRDGLVALRFMESYCERMHRREFLTALAATATVAAQTPASQVQTPAGKGRLKQAVTRGVFGRGANLEDTCKIAADLGIKGYDLIGPADWPILKKYG